MGINNKDDENSDKPGDESKSSVSSISMIGRIFGKYHNYIT